MRKLLMLCLIALSANALSAQNTTRSGSQTTSPSRPPAPASTTTAKPRNTAAPASNPGKTALQTTSTANSPSKTTLQPAAANRSTTPAATRSEPAAGAAQRAANAEPAANTAGGNRATTKTAAPPPQTVPSQMPAAPPRQQKAPEVVVQWMTLEEAMEKCKTEKRKIFIDVFTDWCGWCKRMDESTFVNTDVAQYLNDNYYAVKFNAEQQDDIVFNNKTYHFRKNGARGYHELAAELLNNRLSFPTVVFLDETMNVIQPIPGYLEAAKLETILNYFGTDSHKTTPWETYERRFTNQK